MTRFFTIVVLCFGFFNLSAQDIIYKKDGGKIEGKIIEITNDFIKYKSIDDTDGPLRNFSISEIYMIRYGNGKEEFFSQNQEVGKPADSFFSKKKNQYYASLAVGFGQSYGGLGIRFQGRIGDILGFGYHAGVGYYPSISPFGGFDSLGIDNYKTKGGVWGSVGLKFFWYKAWYLDVQFGTVAQTSTYYYGSMINVENRTIYGPSMLIGGDWFFNKTIGINGAFGSAFNLTDSQFQTVILTLDLGFVVKF